MSFPHNMKTGRDITDAGNSDALPEIFYIIYFVFLAILRRCGYADGKIYSTHNRVIFDKNTYDTGVIFNLYSEFGVGKSLYGMIEELFQNLELNPEKYNNNIFYQEVIRLCPDVVNILRSNDPIKEAEWLTEYTHKMLRIEDDINQDRYERLKVLFEGFDKQALICMCKFCDIFRSYQELTSKHRVTELINSSLLHIAKKVKN